MRSLIQLCVASLLLASGHLAADESPCGGSHLEQMQCLEAEIEALNATLDNLYQATLAKLPDSDRTDSRKGKAQLVRAQEAWRKYRDEHCAFIGGIQGGSNLWVSHFAANCEISETRNRITFFENVPWGDH